MSLCVLPQKVWFSYYCTSISNQNHILSPADVWRAVFCCGILQDLGLSNSKPVNNPSGFQYCKYFCLTVNVPGCFSGVWEQTANNPLRFALKWWNQAETPLNRKMILAQEKHSVPACFQWWVISQGGGRAVGGRVSTGFPLLPTGGLIQSSLKVKVPFIFWGF